MIHLKTQQIFYTVLVINSRTAEVLLDLKWKTIEVNLSASRGIFTETYIAYRLNFWHTLQQSGLNFPDFPIFQWKIIYCRILVSKKLNT